MQGLCLHSSTSIRQKGQRDALQGMAPSALPDMLSHAQGPAKRTSAKKGHGPYRGCGQGWRKGRGGTRQPAPARRTTTPGGARAPGPSDRPVLNPCLSRRGAQPRMQLPPRLGQRKPAERAQGGPDPGPCPLPQEDATLPSSQATRPGESWMIYSTPFLCDR